MSENVQRNETLKKIIQDYEQKEQLGKENEDKQLAITQKYRAFKAVIRAILIVALIIAGVYVIGQSYRDISILRKHKYWVQGGYADSDIKIEGCIFYLWQIRKSIDLYYSLYNYYPGQMSDLYGSGVLNKEVKCPISQQPYVMKMIGQKLSVSCPNPDSHGVRELYNDVVDGPPIIER